ncbi:MAG TPA: DUF4328 domain-containing protein [Pseudonocardiaceae bacterium]|nr:DUF4328 domain-containing protein [Pseudonocardiaceae bacterium]
MSRPARYPASGPVEWVATPPPGRPARRYQPLRRYSGPPRYVNTPRWGFPRLVWRASEQVPGGIRQPERTPRTMLRTARAAGPALWAVAVAAGLAGLGELLRYVLMVIGRDTALPGALVTASDALVTAGSVAGLLAWLVAGVLTVRWLLITRTVAADHAGVRPGRPDWLVLLGVLLPGLNLFLAAPILAELEHTARAETGPVRASRELLAWWVLWAANEIVAVVTVLWRLRSGVQAQADGVLWHLATDLLAVGVGWLTLRLVDRITGLLASSGVPNLARLRVIGVTGAPEPTARPRPANAPR